MSEPSVSSAPVDTAAPVDGALPDASFSQRHPNITLTVASATCAVIVLDTNVVAVSLPSIAHSFHASFAQIEWVVSAYMTAFAACLLPAGGLADRFGRRRTLLGGLVLFALASFACGAAPSAASLIAARAVKGVGASLLLTAALSVIAHRFAQGPARERAWAIWGMCMGIATTLAPWIGGAITQWAGWRWIFLMNPPICLALGIGAWIAIDESRDPHAKRIDAPGSLLFAAALACGVWALIGIPVHGWDSAATLGRVAASAALMAAFVCAERWQARPMIDLALFGRARFVGALLAMFGYAACAQVMMTFLPLYLQIAFGFSALAAGLGMLPFAVAMIVGPQLGAALSRRVATGGVLSAGLALIGVGNLATAACAASGHYVYVALAMLVTGTGAGIMNGDTQKAIMACVPPQRTGMASGISTTTRFAAIVTSVGVLGAVLAMRTHTALAQLVAASPRAAQAVDSHFMASLLAGDLTDAMRTLDTSVVQVLSHAAPLAFARGFSWALLLSGGFALVAAVAVKLLADAREA
ncbi:MFS transporter [Burkholderia sp. Ax-1719]|uniref:MFS transporter n=1 Tax=Burkholderia sp. Ax-1719 TaxID=2608334 RepID=UPI001422A3FD|nr:MFS transporter [Burkholderia sp. Ax-1719]NIE65874.1 MFS transporter [Burkholderia sp. Ax-1719]